jgi:hypothetical protein
MRFGRFALVGITSGLAVIRQQSLSSCFALTSVGLPRTAPTAIPPVTEVLIARMVGAELKSGIEFV